MTQTFITLPSGLRVNTAHILSYTPTENQNKTFVRVSWEDGYGNRSLMEDMTAAELDALLQSQGTPIVSPVIDLDKLRPGSACQFRYEGHVKHGVIDRVDHSSSEAYVQVMSDGDKFTIWPRQNRSTCP